MCFLAVLFSINTLVDLAKYFIPIMQWTHQPIQLSPQERNLLGVNENGALRNFSSLANKVAKCYWYFMIFRDNILVVFFFQNVRFLQVSKAWQ